MTKIMDSTSSCMQDHYKIEISDSAKSEAIRCGRDYLQERAMPASGLGILEEAVAEVAFMANTARRLMDLLADNPDHDMMFRLAGAVIRSAERNHRQVPENIIGYMKSDVSADYSDDFVTQLRDWLPSLIDSSKVLSRDDVTACVARKLEIPIDRLKSVDAGRSFDLHEALSSRIFGQADAVRIVAEAVSRQRAGLNPPGRPAASLFFLGPTGTGKTYLAKVLAETVFGGSRDIVRLDMSEYRDESAVAKLIGAAPGLKGYGEGSYLIESIRNRPHSVVLFDEIEKAHPGVFNLFLQILDDGRLTDSQGRRAHFDHAMLVFTSNLLSDWITNELKAGHNADDMGPDIRYRLTEKGLAPEFVNRFDEFVVFRPLEIDHVRRIVESELTQVTDRFSEKWSRRIDVDPAVVHQLATSGFDPRFGARPLHRAIRRRFTTPLANMVLSDPTETRDLVCRGVDGEIEFEIAAD
ncbi:MAG: ATP-dependent Clp protease ATP-binding subunit [bacterium]|nr:ATP-dependent Clp protease ATP-binding subunit [bacterium]